MTMDPRFIPPILLIVTSIIIVIVPESIHANVSSRKDGNVVLSPSASASSSSNSLSSSPFVPPAATSSQSLPSPDYCIRPVRPHAALNLKPYRKAYPIGSFLIAQCHNDVSVTLICESGGQWNRGLPHCPETNQTCPPFTDFKNGLVTYENTGPSGELYLRSRAMFRCNSSHEIVGTRIAVCEKNFRWSFRSPICSPKQGMQPATDKGPWRVILYFIIVALCLIIAIILPIIYRWWRRKLQKKKWEQYFGTVNSRQSTRKITDRRESRQHSFQSLQQSPYHHQHHHPYHHHNVQMTDL